MQETRSLPLAIGASSSTQGACSPNQAKNVSTIGLDCALAPWNQNTHRQDFSVPDRLLHSHCVGLTGRSLFEIRAQLVAVSRRQAASAGEPARNVPPSYCEISAAGVSSPNTSHPMPLLSLRRVQDGAQVLVQKSLSCSVGVNGPPRGPCDESKTCLKDSWCCVLRDGRAPRCTTR